MRTSKALEAGDVLLSKPFLNISFECQNTETVDLGDSFLPSLPNMWKSSRAVMVSAVSSLMGERSHLHTTQQKKINKNDNRNVSKHTYCHCHLLPQGDSCLNTFAASYLNTQELNNSCLKSPASTLVDLTFQSRALRSFSLNQLRNLSL